jgi:hypothetical protein
MFSGEVLFGVSVLCLFLADIVLLGVVADRFARFELLLVPLRRRRSWVSVADGVFVDGVDAVSMNDDAVLVDESASAVAVTVDSI